MNSNKLILIPGAWSDKTIWEPLETELEKLGIESNALTLDGLKKKDHSKGVDLKGHVDSVVAFLDSQDHKQNYLVGHSYSGLVASMVADQVPEKVIGLVFIEAFLPEDGKSLLEIAGLDIVEETTEIEENGGFWLPPTSDELSSQPFLTEKHIDYLTNNMVGHPGKTVTDKAELVGKNLQSIASFYIGGNLSASVKNNPNFPQIDFHKIEGGHWPMLTMPRKLSEILRNIMHTNS
ncbi:alpha/beta fold hydrolase [Marinoscillum furvescens]|uniref:Alpha/beta hydrolase family protein n=1 Tax=Marinoscillum furvescens DSM 4134 TaxID=1122208 RepID=A0A3D9L6B8_MARFU|nr:alpha/beta hydrolase [Marinoscillum furvescens]REE01246.1 alpha/beta hydrolase family protein [Marinoscillum furvescens DSM 4134]